MQLNNVENCMQTIKKSLVIFQTKTNTLQCECELNQIGAFKSIQLKSMYLMLNEGKMILFVMIFKFSLAGM